MQLGDVNAGGGPLLLPKAVKYMKASTTVKLLGNSELRIRSLANMTGTAVQVLLLNSNIKSPSPQVSTNL